MTDTMTAIREGRILEHLEANRRSFYNTRYRPVAEQVKALVAKIESEGREKLSADEDRTYKDLREQMEPLSLELDQLDGRIAELKLDKERVAIEGLADAYGGRVGNPDGSFSVGIARGGSEAHRLLDSEFRSGRLPDHAAEKATALLDGGFPEQRSLASRWVLAAGSPEYRMAFAKLLGDPQRGHLLWTPAGADAYRQVAAVQAELESRTELH